MHLHHHSLNTKIVAMGNKTVLLYECKRHTDRHLSSTPCAVLSQGHPILTWPRGSTLAPSPLAGVPPILAWLGGPWVSPPGCSTPILTWPGGCTSGWSPLAGYPPSQTRPGGTLGRSPWLGYPHPDLAGSTPGRSPWLGYLHPDLAREYPRWLGYPSSWDTHTAGVPPHLDLAGGPRVGPLWLGYPPHPDLAGGYLAVVPPVMTWLGVYLGLVPLAGYPLAQTWPEGTLGRSPWLGYPPF